MEEEEEAEEDHRVQMVNGSPLHDDEREASNSYCEAFYCGSRGRRKRRKWSQPHRNPQEDVRYQSLSLSRVAVVNL